VTNGVITGYEIAWKDSGAGLYIVWNTDSNGNYANHVLAGVPGTSTTLESIETSFHQDLNGDGTIGVSGTVIQTDTGPYGSTSLTRIADNYYLNNSQLFRSRPEVWRRGIRFRGRPVCRLGGDRRGADCDWLRCRLEGRPAATSIRSGPPTAMATS